MFICSRFVQTAVFTATIVLLNACGEKKETPKGPPKDAPAIVDIIIANPQSISDTVEANGTVIANDYVALHPEVSGRITYLNVPEGKIITKGTVIARINDEDLEAQVAKTKVLLDIAQKTVDRYAQLLAINGINQSDYDVALSTVNGYKADINYTQALIDKTIIKAPFDGKVGLRMVSPGAFVSTTDVIASMQTDDKLKIDFTIPEQYGNLVKIGNSVAFESDAPGANKGMATITAVEPQIDQATRNLKVRALLNKSNINPGAFVKVYINESRNDHAIMVPTNAIIPEDINNQLIVVKNGKASVVKVKTGLRLANNVEITSGINPGDSVVVTGVLFARPKSPLKVRKVLTLDKTSPE
ncbi:MAG TPA: efflux RND transporter periplasmic adaptor subunit [Chitinophagaceae bacterium]|nr:efflux RND transporter periplasmic adaptor subunit [Chitinophagaceae bacterium]